MRAVGGRHRVTRTFEWVSFWGVGTEINRVLMMMIMEVHGQFMMSFSLTVDCSLV